MGTPPDVRSDLNHPPPLRSRPFVMNGHLDDDSVLRPAPLDAGHTRRLRRHSGRAISGMPELVSSSWTGPGSQAGSDVTERSGNRRSGSAPIASRTIGSSETSTATALTGRLLRRPRAGPGSAGDDVHVAPAADAQHHRTRPTSRRSPAFSRTRSAGTWCPLHSRSATASGRVIPYATRDCLHEAEMWAGRGPDSPVPRRRCWPKWSPTCPQYCGHCTRMDLVGNSTPQVDKHQARRSNPPTRTTQIIDHLAARPAYATWWCRAVTWPTCHGRSVEAFVAGLLAIDSVRDIRLRQQGSDGSSPASLQDDVRLGMERRCDTRATARSRCRASTHMSTTPVR